MNIPVICNNPKCGIIWFTSSFISVGAGSTATLTGNTVSPCPNCGGSGAVPDGEYSPIKTNFFRGDQFDKVSSALKRIRSSIVSGASAEDIREQIIEESQTSEYLKGFIPKNLKDIQTLLIIIGMLITAYEYCSSSDPVDQLALPSDLADDLHKIELTLDPSYNRNSSPPPPEQE